MTEAFFSATQNALRNITSTFDMVWPTAVGLWNLRCMVNGVKHVYPSISEAEMAAKFSAGSGIRGVNYKRAFIDTPWDEQQENFAWTLLNSTIPIFEGWLEELKSSNFPDMKLKDLQMPDTVQLEVSRLISNPSVVMTNAFHTVYSTKRDRDYGNIVPLLKCYRVFKEARNCYMHHGCRADQRLIDAYNTYNQSVTLANLGVKELPQFPSPVLDETVHISLRGVVGFSYIVIKMLVSLDAELLCAQNAENEFINRFREKHRILRNLKSNIEGAKRQVVRYVTQCGYATPQAPEELTQLLLTHHLVSL